MIERYSQSAALPEVTARFGLKQPPFSCRPSFNIAPGAMAPVVCHGGMKLLKWGFLPTWEEPKKASGLRRLPFFSSGNPLLKFSRAEKPEPEESGPPKEGFFSVRAEGIASKPAFRAAFYKSRCLVPADGFYTWQAVAGARVPHRFERRDKALFAMAGLYDEASGTYGILTTVANALVRCAHHRMPVILSREEESLWLDPRMKDSETLLPLLRAFDSSLMHGYRVTDLINDPANDSPDCLKQAGE